MLKRSKILTKMCLVASTAPSTRPFSVAPCLTSSNHSRQRELNEPINAADHMKSCTKAVEHVATNRLAQQILERATDQSNLKKSQLTLLSVIVALIRGCHLALVDDIIHELMTRSTLFTPKLMTCVIKAYGEAKRPDKVEEVFYKMLEVNIKPSGEQLKRILHILVANDGYLKAAYDLFREGRRQGLVTNAEPYNILMRAFSRQRKLSIACKLFGEMSKRDSLSDIESYKILIQGMCRRAQVKGAIGLLDDMFNKGFVPDSLIYATLLNSLCRKKGKLGEAYKLLCRMNYKGCKPDVMHYNTVILGYCRQGKAYDACKIVGDMESNGCLPNVVTYRTLVGGLCDQGMLEEAQEYLALMLSKEFSPHFSVAHSLIRELCNVAKIDEACVITLELLKCRETLCRDTWMLLIPRICEADTTEMIGDRLDKVMMMELERDTRIVEAGAYLEKYLWEQTQSRHGKRSNRKG